MGAKWQRDMTGQGKPTNRVPPSQQPGRPGKRKLVWTKDQQDQPATSNAHTNGHQSSGPLNEYDHFEKRARLNQESSAYHPAQQHQYAQFGNQKAAAHMYKSGGKRPEETPQPAPARQDPAAVLAERQKAAELAELKRRIQQQEDAINEQKRDQAAEAQQQAQEQRHEQSKRRAKLEAGFSQAFKRAKEVADAELAQQKAPLKLASEEEVCRVLAATTDWECLQISAGSDAVTIKRKYRELAVALHPDKCKAERATDAFQRLVKAYQNTLKHAKQS